MTPRAFGPVCWPASLLLCVLLPAAVARAAVTASSAQTLTIQHKVSTRSKPADVYRALGRVGKWWNSQHTFSGSAANLKLEPAAGGCFCERWKDGSVEHGRVIHAQRDKLLRLSATLGPLLELGVTGVLSFELEPSKAVQPGGTDLLVTYRISGDPSHNLAGFAEPVDRVLGEQTARLQRFVDTGKAE
jgi:uncharacterized protein YndB with AHSA1/START domain